MIQVKYHRETRLRKRPQTDEPINRHLVERGSSGCVRPRMDHLQGLAKTGGEIRDRKAEIKGEGKISE